jgi:hypothetical protein
MDKSIQETTEAILKAAAALAEKFGMTRQETSGPIFWESQNVLIASAQGIRFGTIRITVKEFGPTRSKNVILNGEVLVTEVDKLTEQGWEPLFEKTIYYPHDAVIYSGI